MKKIAFALSALAAMVSGAAMAQDGTVEIRGRVVDQTCEVATSYKNLVVVLDTVGKKSLDTAGKTAAAKPFHIKLENCGIPADLAGLDLTNIYASFTTPSPQDIDTTTGTLKNRATTGNAGNVNIQLLNSDGTSINLTPFTEGQSQTPATTKTYEATDPEVKFGVKTNYSLTGQPVRTAADAQTAAADILGKKIIGGETEFRTQAEGNNPNKGVAIKANQQAYELQYGAQYYATNAATPGIVEAFVNYTIAYK